MTDVQILSMAIDSSRMSARRFAIEVLGVADRSVRRWLDGRPLPETVRIVCIAITRRPELVAELTAAHATIVAPAGV